MTPRRLTLAALCLSLLAFSACQKDAENEAATPQIGFRGGNARPPVRPLATPSTTVLPDPGDAAAANLTPPPPQISTVPSQPVVQQPVAHDYQYATPIPDKPGVVMSPYAPGKQVDVHGYAPGQEVRDPYTDKIFLVP